MNPDSPAVAITVCITLTKAGIDMKTDNSPKPCPDSRQNSFAEKITKKTTLILWAGFS